MMKHVLNAVTFLTKEYDEACPLEIEPKPMTVIRVFLVYRAVEAGMKLKPQVLSAPERVGFTVVEWGGAKLSPRLEAK